MQIYAFYHYLHVFSFFMTQILTIINPHFPYLRYAATAWFIPCSNTETQKSNTLPAQRPLFSKHHSLEKVYGFDHYSLEKVCSFSNYSLEKVYCFSYYSLEKVCCFSYYSLEKVCCFSHYSLEKVYL